MNGLLKLYPSGAILAQSDISASNIVDRAPKTCSRLSAPIRLARALLLLGLLMVLSGCVVVEDGTIGVSKSFGEISDVELKPGVYANVPIIREIEVWNVKTQRRRIQIVIPSLEGLMVNLESQVLFRPTQVVALRKTVGQDYVQKILVNTLADVFRQIIGKQRVEEIIKSQETMSGMAQANIAEQMEKRGIIVEQLLVTGLGLPVKFKEAVERKLESEQKALQKQFELEQAKKDAEIEVAKAKGLAEAQEIVRKTLSSEYLQYLWISTLNENPNVIYVATEANMPMFRSEASGRRARAKAIAKK
jgi:regulator of protease activity HflC (stomatin/prohibitin superfamily)